MEPIPMRLDFDIENERRIVPSKACSNMVNALNIRHRTSAVPDGLLSPTHQGLESNKRDLLRRKKSRSSASKDTRFALIAVVTFLVIGLAAGYFLLHHQHRRAIGHVLQQHWGNVSMQTGEQGLSRFVTIVMPSVVNPPGRLKRLNEITNTWGPSSRALYVVHNLTDFPLLSNDVVSLDSGDASLSPALYPKLLLVPPSIAPEQGVLRLNYVIRTVFEKINPDFAFFVNDHTYVIPEHLCKYLSDKDPALPLYAGHALRQDQDYFNSGAAGYVLSRHSMNSLVGKWEENDATCLAKDAASWLQGNPGLTTAKCLVHVVQTPAVDTRQDGKFHRFHAFGLVRSVTGNVDQWYINKHKDMDKILGTDPSYTTLVNGSDCCSDETVSFHYVEHMENKALFSTRQALLLNPKLSDSDLKALMIRNWPKERKRLGFYSHGLPDENDAKSWDPILTVMRKISDRSVGSECS